jgi:hypothetical protein
MSSNFKQSLLMAKAQAGDGSNYGALTLLANGNVTFYGSAQPSDPDTAVSGQTNFGNIPLGNPGASMANGVLSLLTSGNGVVLANGIPAWFRIYANSGSALWDGSCGNTGNGTYDGNVGGTAWVVNQIIPGPGLGSITINHD